MELNNRTSLRSKAVAEARSIGICTQCLRHKAIRDRRQCQRCIDTNRRKQRKRGSYDPVLRTKVREFCIKHNICTKCCGRECKEGLRQCSTCLDIRKDYKMRAYERNPDLNREYYQKNSEHMKELKREYDKKRNADKKKESTHVKNIKKYGLVEAVKLMNKNKTKMKVVETKKVKAKKKVLTKAELKEQAKEYKKKALYNKVRKLDRIRYAVEMGKEL